MKPCSTEQGFLLPAPRKVVHGKRSVFGRFIARATPSLFQTFRDMRDEREMQVRAALWVVGQTKDVRFANSVTGLMNRPETEVLAAALRISALKEIRFARTLDNAFSFGETMIPT